MNFAMSEGTSYTVISETERDSKISKRSGAQTTTKTSPYDEQMADPPPSLLLL